MSGDTAAIERALREVNSTMGLSLTDADVAVTVLQNLIRAVNAIGDAVISLTQLQESQAGHLHHELHALMKRVDALEK